MHKHVRLIQSHTTCLTWSGWLKKINAEINGAPFTLIQADETVDTSCKSQMSSDGSKGVHCPVSEADWLSPYWKWKQVCEKKFKMEIPRL